jgi:hypothetical protein
MTVVYSNTIKNNRMTQAELGIDNNAAAANLLIGTAAMATTLVTIPLSKPSFTVSGNAMTMAGVPHSGTASATGTAAAAQINDGGGTAQVTGLTVGTSGTDIVLNSTSITSGQTVTITAGTITHG